MLKVNDNGRMDDGQRMIDPNSALEPSAQVH